MKCLSRALGLGNSLVRNANLWTATFDSTRHLSFSGQYSRELHWLLLLCVFVCVCVCVCMFSYR